MTRLALLAALAFSGLGCANFRAVGPMKNVFPPAAEKDAISHRGRALEALAPVVAELLSY